MSFESQPSRHRIFPIALLMCLPACASNYYVSNSGRDVNSGTSAASPWQTLAKVNAASFRPGDSIFLKRGDTWHEELVPPSSGSPGNQITISAYGAGAKPVVSGGDLVSQWTPGAGGIWCSALATAPKVVFIAGTLGVQKPLSLLSKTGNWNWTLGSLCVYNAEAPPSEVEAAQRDYALLLGQTGAGSYVSVIAIDFHLANVDTVHIVNTTGDALTGGSIDGAYQFGIFAIGVSGSTVDHLLISQNRISANGSSGVEISFGHNNVTVERNLAFGNAYNGQNTENFQFMAGIYLFSNDSTTPTHDVVAYNISRNNGVRGGTESQGSGIWMDTLSDSTMSFNLTHDNTAYGIYLEKNIGSSMTDNVSYSNGHAANSANIGCYASYGTPATGNVVANNVSWSSYGLGLKLGAYQGGGLTQFENNTVTNNVIINSAGMAVVFDSGANNDNVHGTGNTYVGNSFGVPQQNWIYWLGVGRLSTYADLASAYGAPMGDSQSAITHLSGTLQNAGVNSATTTAIMAQAQQLQ